MKKLLLICLGIGSWGVLHASDSGDSKRAAEANEIANSASLNPIPETRKPKVSGSAAEEATTIGADSKEIAEQLFLQHKQKIAEKKAAYEKMRAELRKEISPKIEKMLKNGVLPFVSIDLKIFESSQEKLKKLINDGSIGMSLMRVAIAIGDEALVNKMLDMPVDGVRYLCNRDENNQAGGFSYSMKDALRFGGPALYEKIIRWAMRDDVRKAGFRLDDYVIYQGVASRGCSKIVGEYFAHFNEMRTLYSSIFQYCWKTPELQALIDEKIIEVDCCNSSNITLLAHAASTLQVPTVRMLLDHGADPNKVDEHGKRAIDYVPSYTRRNADEVHELRKLLKPNASINDIAAVVVGSNGTMSRNVASIIAAYGIYDAEDILYVALKGNSQQLGYLLEDGYNANECNADRKCPLHWAAENVDRESIERLFAKKANVNAIENHGMSALMFCSEQGKNSDVIQLLLHAKADPNIQSTYSSPEGSMRRRQRAGEARARYRQRGEGEGFEPVKEVAGTTALMIAVHKKDVQNVENLLKDGRTDVTLKDKDNKTALDHVNEGLADKDCSAKDGKAFTAIKMLLENYTSPDKGDAKSNAT